MTAPYDDSHLSPDEREWMDFFAQASGIPASSAEREAQKFAKMVEGYNFEDGSAERAWLDFVGVPRPNVKDNNNG